MVPLVVHAVGWMLLVSGSAGRRVASVGAVGSLMMLVGSVGEFWIFSAESYQSVVRLASWMTFLLGTVATVIGLAALAVRRLRSR